MVKARLPLLALALLLAACPPLDKKAIDNQPPLAVVIVTPTGTIAGGTRVTMDASGSSDPEGRPLRFTWQQLAGEPIAFEGQGEPIATFEAPLRPQLLVFSLTVSDGKQDSAPAYARLTVDYNTPPRAEVPDSRDVENGTQVLLSGDGTDADDDEIVGYAWAVEAAPSASGVPVAYELSGQTTKAAIFTPRLKGLYTLSLRVTDARGAVSQPGLVVINALNVAPVVTSIAPVLTPNLTAVTITGAATDEDPTDTLTYRWELDAAPSGAPLPDVAGESTARLTVTPKAKGLYAFWLIANDGETDSEPARVLVSAVNNVPTATAAPLTTPNRAPLTLIASTSDLDGDDVSVEWSVPDAGGKAFTLGPAAGGLTIFTPTAKGTFLLHGRPHDGQEFGAGFDVALEATNLAPVAAVSASVATASTGQTFTLSAAGSSDPDGPTNLSYSWSVRQGVASIDGGGPVVQVTAGSLKQALQFELVVRDETDAGSAPVQTQVIVDNTAPTAVAGTDGFAGAGDTVQLDGIASSDLESGPGGLQYQWRCVSNPGLALSSGGTLRNPTFVAPTTVGATLVFELIVSDGRASSAPSLVSYEVVPGDATNLFVNAASTCATTCDGTRAKPYPTISAGAAASAGLGAPRPVLVASGQYPAALIPSGISVSGGCDPVRWRCDRATGPSVVRASVSQATALEVTGTSSEPGVIEGLEVHGSAGDSVPAGTVIRAVRCNGCKVTLRDLRAEARGHLTLSTATIAVDVTSTAGPVLLDAVEAIAGQGIDNVALNFSDVSNARVTRSFATTLIAVRTAGLNAAFPDYHRTRNVTVSVNGTGAGVVFERNRLTVEGNTNLDYAHLIRHNGTLPSYFVGNFLWFKANAGPNRQCCGEWGFNSAVRIDCSSQGNLYLLNNTLLGNDQAWNSNVEYVGFQLYDDGYCPGASGTSYATNNYVQKFRNVVWGNTGARLRMQHNSLFEFDNAACVSGNCSGGLASLNTSSGVTAPGSTGNTQEDCRLVSTLTGDWHLRADAGSPCVDTGLLDPLAPTLDLDGDARPLGGQLDRGADELP